MMIPSTMAEPRSGSRITSAPKQPSTEHRPDHAAPAVNLAPPTAGQLRGVEEQRELRRLLGWKRRMPAPSQRCDPDT